MAARSARGTPPLGAPAKGHVVVPAAPRSMDTDWTVACRAGLRGTAGNLGLTENIEDKLHGTYGPLRFAGLEPSGDDIVPDEDPPGRPRVH